MVADAWLVVVLAAGIVASVLNLLLPQEEEESVETADDMELQDKQI